VAWQAIWPSNDLGGQLVPQRPQLLRIEFVCFSGKAGQRVWPLRIRNVDAPASVVAERARESQHFQLLLALLSGDTDSLVDAIDGLGLNLSGHERLPQGFFLVDLLLLEKTLLIHFGEFGI